VLKYDDHGTLVSANLDIKNPNGKQDLEHLPPEQLLEDILAKEQRILEILKEVKAVLETRS
jgi:type I restriction enzyme M protein